MNAHQLDEAGYVLNTIVVDSLDVLPNLHPYIGGAVGDRIVKGALVLKKPVPAEVNAPILAALSALDTRSTRALREGDQARINEINIQAAALRLQLIK